MVVQLVGRTLVDTGRYGKVFYLTLDGGGRMPVLHLGMTGMLHVGSVYDFPILSATKDITCSSEDRMRPTIVRNQNKINPYGPQSLWRFANLWNLDQTHPKLVYIAFRACRRGSRCATHRNCFPWSSTTWSYSSMQGSVTRASYLSLRIWSHPLYA